MTLYISFFSNRSGVCKTKLLQDTPLITLVCFLLIIDGMIVTLWASLDPMTRQLKNLTVELNPNDRSVVYQPQVGIGTKLRLLNDDFSKDGFKK